MELAEKKFYDRQFERQPPEVIDVDAVSLALRTPGDRYFCLTDYLENPGSLDAIEWGFGGVARLIALQRLFRSYTALDISAASLMRGQTVDAKIIECNLNAHLPVPDEAFDVSIAMMVIEHLFDPFHSFEQLSRTTKRGGLAFVNLPIVTGIKNRARLLLGQLPVTSQKNWWEYREWDGGHLHYFTIDSVRRLGAMYNLSLERTYAVGRLPKLKNYLPSLLCGELSFVFRKV